MTFQHHKQPLGKAALLIGSLAVNVRMHKGTLVFCDVTEDWGMNLSCDYMDRFLLEQPMTFQHHKQPIGKALLYCQQRLLLQLLAAGEGLLGTPTLVK